MAARKQTFMSPSQLGNIAGLIIAALYTMAGQAHFTASLTPGLAAQIDEMTPNSHRAFWFLHLDYAQIKTVFGTFDLVAAALLWRRTTRKLGLAMAVVGFTGGWYGQWYSGGGLGQISGFLGLAVVGFFAMVYGEPSGEGI